MSVTISFLQQSDAKVLNAFVEQHPLGSVHQLWEWGMFQTKTSGRDKFWVIVAKDDAGTIKASALFFRQSLPLGKCWLYCPRGPLLPHNDNAMSHLLFAKIKEVALQEKALFLRFDPGISNQLAGEYDTFFKEIKSRPAHAHYQPESTLLIDLRPSCEAILAQMKQKGRYNIKVAQRYNVIVKESSDVEKFYQLFQTTTSRDAFQGHSLQYYHNIMEILGSDRAKLYMAYYNEIPVAAAMVTYCRDTATYYFGASGNEHREVMAPYLLHWHIMQEAKSVGYQWYDLFGIAPADKPNHPWAGVTQFKEKFGGTRLDYMDAQEIVYKPLWYGGLKVAKKVLTKRPI